MRDEIERFLRRLGYRLVLRELRHARNARAGDPLSPTMKWQNVGSAPCYRPYRLAYRLTDANGANTILSGNVMVEKWMPGTVDVFTEDFLKEPPELPAGEIVTVTNRISLPQDLRAARYSLAIGIVDEHSSEPVVRLAIQGRSPDGWYPLSEIVLHE